MILYHSSRIKVQHPDLTHSRSHLDFGNGFYLTSIRNQAEKYGARFSIRYGEAVLNIYEWTIPPTSYSHLVFSAYNGDWLDFVTACRKGLDVPHYDYIEGGIANDNVFDTCDLYFSGKINRDQALNRLKFEHPNHQICIANQELLNNNLNFLESIPL